jgi:hypothetical protein
MKETGNGWENLLEGEYLKTLKCNMNLKDNDSRSLLERLIKEC